MTDATQTDRFIEALDHAAGFLQAVIEARTRQSTMTEYCRRALEEIAHAKIVREAEIANMARRRV